VTQPVAEAMQLFAEGKVDAVLGFPPEPQELRAKKIGHSIVNTATDRPWSQYFCCPAAGHRDFVSKYPVATKRVLRSFLKAANLCAMEPERVARFLTDRGYIRQHEYAAQALKEVPYKRWRELDSADTVRYFALRLHESGMIKATPHKLIASGTDWRYFNELKLELKA
jgi:NitT/TauT family transport system substrate-binding protein